MPVWLRRAAVVGGAAGAVAVGAAMGVAAEKYAGSRRLRVAVQAAGLRDPDGDAYGSLHGEGSVVIADDGVPLHVEVGEGDGGVNLVLVHGYSLTSDSWHYQRRDLADLGRVVTYDQRGHGLSPLGDPDCATIDQLGRDLDRVLAESCDERPVVLVGHSMGGMAVMALAQQRPELFGGRVRGVALISTSTGRLAEVTLGVPLRGARLVRRAAPAVLTQLARRPDLVARGRQLVNDVELLAVRRWSYASDVPASLVEFTARMIASVPVETVAEFWPAFDAHDKLAALDVLAATETLLLVGEDDLLTPADHTRTMAAALPGSVPVVVPAAGHLVPLEHPETVNAHIRALVDRVLA